jgi:hypothetical protein
LVVVVSGVVAGCKAFGGVWVGSATKAQIPKMTAYAWVEVVATVAPKGRTLVTTGRTLVAAGTSATAPEVGKTGAGDMAAVEL